MLLNQAETKKYILERAAWRHHPFSRVSAEMMHYLDGELRKMVDNVVWKHPSKGKTIYPPVRADRG